MYLNDILVQYDDTRCLVKLFEMKGSFGSIKYQKSW